MDTRTQAESNSVADATPTNRHDVHLPRWVNEPLPDVQSILNGREIARLTRRPRWLLLGLARLGRFPKRRTRCGKPIGWHRADVLAWLTQNMTVEPDRRPESWTRRQTRPRHVCLPLEITPTCRTRSEAHRRHSAGGPLP